MIGMMFEKVGMTSVFDKNEKMIAVTVLQMIEMRVLGVSDTAKQGYAALRLAYGVNKKEKRKAMMGFYKGMVPAQGVKEFRLSSAEANELRGLVGGSKVSLTSLQGVSHVDARARSVGRGFQGVVKRHGMAGGPKTHGSHFHRVPGSIGMCADPARVFKGRKLPGQMGFVNVCVQNLPVFSIDAEKGVLLVAGSIPGRNGALVRITPAIKMRLEMKIEIESDEVKVAPVPGVTVEEVAAVDGESGVAVSK